VLTPNIANVSDYLPFLSATACEMREFITSSTMRETTELDEFAMAVLKRSGKKGLDIYFNAPSELR
jgi:hypothetical protein